MKHEIIKFYPLEVCYVKYNFFSYKQHQNNNLETQKFKVSFIKDRFGTFHVIHVVKCEGQEKCVPTFYNSYKYGYVQPK